MCSHSARFYTAPLKNKPSWRNVELFLDVFVDFVYKAFFFFIPATPYQCDMHLLEAVLHKQTLPEALLDG